MTYAVNIGDAISSLAVIPTATQTASTNSTGVDLQPYEGQIAFLLDAAAGTGTTPTCAIKIQDSADNSTFADVAGLTFTGLTTVASRQKLVTEMKGLRRYVRAVTTIGGTTPSYALSLQAVAAAKYPS